MTEQNTKVENQTQENQEQNGTNKNKNKSGMNGPLTRTVTGSILGATVGYLATPENGKKLIGKIDQEKLKNKGKDFGRATKEKSKQAAGSIKTSTANLFKRDKQEDSEVAAGNEEENETVLNSENTSSPDSDSEQQENQDRDDNSLNEENDSFQNRLEDIEDKIDRLMRALGEDDSDSDEDDEDEEEPSSKSKKRTKKATQPSNENEDEDELDEDEE